jgi:hypothetical protein
MAHEKITESAPEKDPLFKLRNSPLHGVDPHRSGWYRKLMGAGYKGMVHGSLGGVLLFAVLGGGLGLATALTLTYFYPAGIGTLLLSVPIMASAGALYGKSTFGQIASTAAIIAQSDELGDRRRTLLDRLEKTKSKAEAEEILGMIDNLTEDKPPEKWFHGRTALVGALVVGGLAMLALGTLGGTNIEGIVHALEKVIPEQALAGAFTEAMRAIGVPGIFTIVGGIGALAGSVIGVDRTYIRKWFDLQEGLHDDHDIRHKVQEHDAQIDRLKTIRETEGADRLNYFEGHSAQEPEPPLDQKYIADSNRPNYKVSGTAVIEKILSQDTKERISAL